MVSATNTNLTGIHWLRPALRVGLAALAGTLLLCLVILIDADGDPLSFAFIGTRFSERDPDGTVGYDGQFFYFIARDGADAVPYIDGPAFRYQRILYPVVSRALALGQADAVPWTLILVNVLAHSGGAALVAYLLASRGVSPWYALVYAAWIGGLYGVRFNLSEPLCFALGLAALIAYRHERLRWTALLLILATLTKELGLIFAGALALHAVSKRRWGWSMLLAGAPLLALLLWWGFLALWLPDRPTQYPAARFSRLPFGGLLREEDPLEFALLVIWLVIPALVLLLAALRQMWRRRAVPLEAALVVTSVGFLAIMPGVSWDDPVAAYRVAMAIVPAGLLFAARYHPRALRGLALLWGSTFLLFLLMLAAIAAR